jgi:hypothetical protein
MLVGSLHNISGAPHTDNFEKLDESYESQRTSTGGQVIELSDLA